MTIHSILEYQIRKEIEKAEEKILPDVENVYFEEYLEAYGIAEQNFIIGINRLKAMNNYKDYEEALSMVLMEYNFLYDEAGIGCFCHSLSTLENDDIQFDLVRKYTKMFSTILHDNGGKLAAILENVHSLNIRNELMYLLKKEGLNLESTSEMLAPKFLKHLDHLHGKVELVDIINSLGIFDSKDITINMIEYASFLIDNDYDRTMFLAYIRDNFVLTDDELMSLVDSYQNVDNKILYVRDVLGLDINELTEFYLTDEEILTSSLLRLENIDINEIDDLEVAKCLKDYKNKSDKMTLTLK